MLSAISTLDGLTTVIGLALVFSILAILVFVVIAMKKLPEWIGKLVAAKVRESGKAEELPAEGAATMSVENDEEAVVAAITACIALIFEGEGNSEGINKSRAPFRIKSIKKIN